MRQNSAQLLLANPQSAGSSVGGSVYQSVDVAVDESDLELIQMLREIVDALEI